MYSKCDDKEIMINEKADKIIKNFLTRSFIDIKLGYNN